MRISAPFQKAGRGVCAKDRSEKLSHTSLCHGTRMIKLTIAKGLVQEKVYHAVGLVYVSFCAIFEDASLPMSKGVVRRQEA